jgi:hypothetical protein
VKRFLKALLGLLGLAALMLGFEVFGPSKTVISNEINPNCMRLRECVSQYWGLSRTCSLYRNERPFADLPAAMPGDRCDGEWLVWSSCSYSTFGSSIGCRLRPAEGSGLALYSLAELWRIQNASKQQNGKFLEWDRLRMSWEPPRNFSIADCGGDPIRFEASHFRVGLRSSSTSSPMDDCFVLDSKLGAKREQVLP